MGLFSRPQSASKEDLAAYRKAKDKLEAVSKNDRKAGRHYETEAYLDANDAVIKAEKSIPRWQR